MEFTGNLTGYLSPSAGLKYADTQDGQCAVSKVPVAGSVQSVGYGAF